MSDNKPDEKSYVFFSIFISDRFCLNYKIIDLLVS